MYNNGVVDIQPMEVIRYFTYAYAKNKKKSILPNLVSFELWAFFKARTAAFQRLIFF